MSHMHNCFSYVSGKIMFSFVFYICFLMFQEDIIIYLEILHPCSFMFLKEKITNLRRHRADI